MTIVMKNHKYERICSVDYELVDRPSACPLCAAANEQVQKTATVQKWSAGHLWNFFGLWVARCAVSGSCIFSLSMCKAFGSSLKALMGHFLGALLLCSCSSAVCLQWCFCLPMLSKKLCGVLGSTKSRQAGRHENAVLTVLASTHSVHVVLAQGPACKLD